MIRDLGFERARLSEQMAHEQQRVVELHPRSAELSRAHAGADADRHTEVFTEALAALTRPSPDPHPTLR